MDLKYKIVMQLSPCNWKASKSQMGKADLYIGY
jgi:hypothetical protein